MCATWNKNYDPTLIARGIEKIKSQKNGGVSFEGYRFDDYMSVLLSSVKFDDTIPDSEKKGITMDAITEAGKAGPLTTQSIISEISKSENRYLSREAKPLVLFTTISLKYRSFLTRARIKNTTIVFSGIRPAGFSQSELNETIRNYIFGELPRDYTYVRVFLKARSNAEAGDNGIDALDLLRAIWNLGLNKSTHREIFFARENPVNRILLGPIHTLHNRKGAPASTVFSYEPSYRKPIRSFDIRRYWSNLKKFEKTIRKKIKKVNYSDSIEKALIRYTRALDEWDYNSAFIRLWSILEYLTYTLNDRYDKTVKRTSFLYKDRQLHREILNHLRDRRNEFVHHDKSDESIDTSVFQLKRYVESLLFFHINTGKNFSTISEACEFLDIPTDISVLEKRIKHLRKVLTFLK